MSCCAFCLVAALSPRHFHNMLKFIITVGWPKIRESTLKLYALVLKSYESVLEVHYEATMRRLYRIKLNMIQN